MKQKRLHSIIQFIEKNWQSSGAWPDYIGIMRQILLTGQERTGAGGVEGPSGLESGIVWVDLQALCCQSVGGDPALTTPSTAAWYLLYAAAHIFDHLEDQDELPGGLAGYSPGELINAATGLLFSASLMLNELLAQQPQEDLRQVADQISRDFYISVLRMAGGQQRDMRTAEPSVDEWLAIAAAKSGSFFALACRCGARWGTNDSARIEHFGLFGNQLGVLLQLRDDISDLSPALLEGKRPAEFARSLAAAYARSVLPQEGKAEFSTLIQRLPSDPAVANDLIAMLDGCGTGLYLRAELERQRGIAKAALEAARPDQPAREVLMQLLNRLCEV